MRALRRGNRSGDRAMLAVKARTNRAATARVRSPEFLVVKITRPGCIRDREPGEDAELPCPLAANSACI